MGVGCAEVTAIWDMVGTRFLVDVGWKACDRERAARGR